MEESEKRYIFRNLTDLVDNTQWNTSCVSVPIQTSVFSYDDTAQLESIPNLRMRVLEFYRIFMTKHNSYQHLIATLEKGRQSGAVEILRSLNPIKYPTQLEQKVSSCSTSETDKTGQMTQQHATRSIVDFPMEKLHITTNKNSCPEQFAMTENADQGGIDMNSQTIQQPIKRVNKIQTSNSIRFDVHNPTRFFTGRMKELSELHEKMQHSNTKRAVVSQMASVTGLGGIGKTELVRMYIHQYAEEYDNNVIWIRGETKETLTESFLILATNYLNLSLKNVDGEEKQIKTLIDEVYRYFNGEKSLFVFDNAECKDTLQIFLPLQVANPPQILITSRDREWSFGVVMMELNEMEETEAIALVKYGLNIQDQDEDHNITQLVKMLQCFPLALSQAISYIKEQQMQQNYNISQYLEEYKSCSEKLLSCGVLPAAISTYTETTFTTWKVTTKFISAIKDFGKEAMIILNMISYFEPDKIPTKLLLCSGLSNLKGDNVTVAKNTVQTSMTNQTEKNKKAVQLLLKYSLVNIQPAEEIITIHRLLQEVTRIELRKNEQEETTLRHALKLLFENFALSSMRHFCSTYKYCGGYKELVVEFKDTPWKVLEKMDENDLPIRYLGVNIGTELRETLQEHVSLEDVDAIRLEYQIAVANARVGNLEVSVKILERILPNYLENKAGLFTNEEVLNVQFVLSVFLKELGKQTESLKAMLQTYERSKVVNGLNYWWTIQVLVDAADCLCELGHFKKPFVANAKNLQCISQDISVPQPQEILSLLKAAYENNKHLINSDNKFSNLIARIASFLYEVGDNDLASIIANVVYEQGRNSNDIMVQVDSMRCLNLLAVLKSIEGKHEESLDISREVHTFYSHTLGNSHLDTLTYKRNMLIKLRQLGRAETAFEGFHEVLKVLMKSYPNHPDVFRTEMDVGATLVVLKRFEEGLELLVNLKIRIVDRFGLTNPLLPDVNYWIEEAQNVTFE